MKKIQPFQIWINGSMKTAEWLNAYVIHDNLSTQAQFYWGLYAAGEDATSQGEQLAQGNLTMTGQDYIDWNVNPDINEDAYVWIAAQLGLTLV